MAYKYSIGQPFMYPRNDLRYAENFLHMTFNVPCEDKPVSPVLARAMDRIFILHADHEQNASTSTAARACPTAARSTMSPPRSTRFEARSTPGGSFPPPTIGA